MPSRSIERFYLDSFVAARPEFLLVDDTEGPNRPDFIMRDKSGLIGMEVTQLFRDDSGSGSPSRTTESIRDRHLLEVRRAYVALGGRPITLRARLAGRPVDEPKWLAHQLMIHRRPEPLDASTFTTPTGDTYFITPIPDYLGNDRLWVAIDNHVGLVGQLKRPVILARIASKAQKLDSYRSVVQRVALLLYVERTAVSGFMEWREAEMSYSPQGFEAIYLHFHLGETFQLA